MKQSVHKKRPVHKKQVHKKSKILKKSQYYRQQQLRYRIFGVAAILVIVLLILLIRSCASGKAKPASSGQVQTEEKITVTNVKNIFEADNLTIANFEGTLTDSEDREDKQFAFKAPASYADILTAGSVEAVNTANNHSHDYGDQSFDDTLSALDAAGIIHFGYDETAVTEVNGIKVGMVGIYELNDHLGREEQLKQNIEKVKKNGAQLIVVIFHWGNEKEEVPDSNQTTLGHLAIDLGADLVCGHHPHVLQGIEEYKGKNIVYSLGNFCFGGNAYPSDMDTMIFQQTFTIDSNGVKADNVTNIIPCSISSDSDYNNYQPTPASGEEADRILQKIQERSSWIGSGSTENSEGNDTYEDSEGTDSEDSSEDYSGDEDLTDSYDEM